MVHRKTCITVAMAQVDSKDKGALAKLVEATDKGRSFATGSWVLNLWLTMPRWKRQITNNLSLNWVNVTAKFVEDKHDYKIKIEDRFEVVIL
ncbi:hypothetical protein LEMLEM_LOCUS6508 [Lemmus lemmus]